jgi:hypothetical protein
MSAQAWALFDGHPDDYGNVTNTSTTTTNNSNSTTKNPGEIKIVTTTTTTSTSITPPSSKTEKSNDTNTTKQQQQKPSPTAKDSNNNKLPKNSNNNQLPPWSIKLSLPLPNSLPNNNTTNNNNNKTPLPPRQQNPTFIAPGFSHPCLFQHRDVAFRPRVNNRGGGRGYIATKDILPGTLLLSELPIADIPDTPYDDRDPAERCLLHLASGEVSLEKAKIALEDLKLLHPRNISEIDDDRKRSLEPSCLWLMQELTTTSKYGKELGLTNPEILLRTLCTLHFNGFVTGVYIYLAMINHSCVPNCVKWGARDGQPHSEVRATRFIRAGEEITLSYLVPACRSRVARRRALFGQFAFECTCDLCEGKCNPQLEDLMINHGIISETLENELEDLEQNELSKHPQIAFDRAMNARKIAISKGLQPRHLAIARADMIIAEAILKILDESDQGGDRNTTTTTATTSTNRVDVNLIIQLLTSSISLRQTQVIFFRQGIPDYDHDRTLAAKSDTRSEAEPTLHHIASAIGFLNGKGKIKELLSLKFDNGSEVVFQNVQEAIACQVSCERVSKMIADLYD